MITTCHSAYADDQATREEIVYRTNLGRADDIKLLVGKGASPNQADGNSVPIICLAATRADSEGLNIIKTLIELGANINATDPKGQNALFYASKAGNPAVATYLLLAKIDSQAIDAEGNTARAFASNTGHTNVVEAMDKFVNDQNNVVGQQQNELKMKMELDKEAALKAKAAPVPAATAPASVKAPAPVVAATSPSSAEALVAIADTKAQEAMTAKVKEETKLEDPAAFTEPFNIDEAKLENAPAPDQQKAFDAIIKNTIQPQEDANEPEKVEKPLKADKTPEQIAANQAAKEVAKAEKKAAAEKRAEDIKHMAYGVAYHTCAFQYWAYCLQVRQSTELGSEELTIAIQTQKDEVEGLQKKLLVDYKQPASFYDNITHSAMLRIYNQLSPMPSNRMRHENGVGKMDDMQQRCEEIGRQWGFPASLRTNPPARAGKGAKVPGVRNSPR